MTLRSCLLLAFLATACGGSTGSDGSGATGGSGGGSGGGGAGGSGGSGALGGAGSGGGSAGAAGPCMTDADCGEGVCGFPTSEGCAAEGQCFPTPTAICNAYSPGCACDGTETSLICMGLPDGYTPKPLAHPGSCSVSFACGDALTCESGTQFCEVGIGGPCCGPPSYSCETIPAACTDDHTCACIQAAVNAQECSELDGAVTVTFLYP